MTRLLSQNIEKVGIIPNPKDASPVPLDSSGSLQIVLFQVAAAPAIFINMEGPLIASLCSLCSSVVHRSTACYTEIHTLILSSGQSRVTLGGLEILAGLIHEVSQYTNELNDALEKRPVVSPMTHTTLDNILGRLDSIYGKLNKQLMRLDGQNIDRVEPTYLQAHHNLVGAHSKFVGLLLDIVTM